MAASDTILHPGMFPDSFADEDHLEEFMSTPSQALIDDLAALEGDIAVLGCGGKMGVTLARMVKRAAPKKRVLGVSRFSEPGLEEKMASWGVETLVCDMLERDQVAAIPKLPNIIYMAGKKFGTEGAESFTWAMNTVVPSLVGEAFPESRIVAFSTILVYPFSNVHHQGSVDSDPPYATSGEYANSCVGRERTFEYYSRVNGNPARNIRLAYSIDMRYGVLHEVGSQVWRGEPIDVTTGSVNVIWQGDANSQIARALNHCTSPASPLIISGPETISIRALAQSFGRRLGKDPVFTGSEAETCCLVNAGHAADLFGYPMVPLERMVTWVADWVANDKLSWNKPCHYEVRDGVF
jgi:nucleoside-diphosphate-sugar epimerase